MKNKIIFSILIAITLLLSSCENNFNPQIYGELSSTNFPKTESDYEALLMTCYVPFEVNWSYNLTGGSWQHGFYVAGDGCMRLFDATSDYCAPWMVNSDDGAGQQYTEGNFANFTLFVPTDDNNPPHFEKIRDITRFTEIIGELENSTVLSDTIKKNFVGEARLLRGMMMYYLLHIYGPVPVILNPALVGNTVAEENMVRPSLDSMVVWITNDLEYAVANMSNSATIPHGRYTADYARFCLMRHCLNEGSYMSGYYDMAIEMYNELKTSGYSLFTADGVNSYADQFMQGHKFNCETIEAVSTSASADGSAGNGNFNPTSWYVVPSNAAKYADAANTIPTPFVYQGGGWGQNYNVSPAYYDTYEPGDLRKNVILTSYIQNDNARTNITVADIGVKWSGFIINKYPIEIPSQFQPTDIPLARWADVLLMYAEAVARKTNAVPTGEAMQGVNDVRARAGLAPLSGAATASYDGFMDALLAERGHELLYEGCRKIDLIRFNKYRHNCFAIKGIEPTSQYLPIPNYAVLQAASYGKTLTQFFERPDYGQDN
jgi:hypothetical protein